MQWYVDPSVHAFYVEFLIRKAQDIDTAASSGAVRQTSSSKSLQKAPGPAMLQGRVSEFPVSLSASQTSQFDNEGLLKAWRKYQKS